MRLSVTFNSLAFRYKKELAVIAAMIPYDQMTMEDAYDAFPPEQRFDPLNNPTFWPHDEHAKTFPST